MSERDNKLGALDSIIFREPPVGLDEKLVRSNRQYIWQLP